MWKTFVVISSFITSKYSIPCFIWALVLVWELGVLVMDVVMHVPVGSHVWGVLYTCVQRSEVSNKNLLRASLTSLNLIHGGRAYWLNL